MAGDLESMANGINGAGEVVGNSCRSFCFGWAPESNPRTAVVWDRDGIPAPLPFLPGDTWSEAAGINAPGEIVGFSIGSEGSTAVVWR
jgi:uncharacterized membrane protein